MAIKPGSMFIAHMRNCEPCRDTETLCVVGLQIVATIPSIAEIRRLQHLVAAEEKMDELSRRAFFDISPSRQFPTHETEDFELEARRHQALIEGELN